MAIDRTSSSDDDNDELGVLDDLSTSTTAIDLGMTAQVSVVLPAGYQDDRDDDDDVIADELDPAGDSAEDAGGTTTRCRSCPTPRRAMTTRPMGSPKPTTTRPKTPMPRTTSSTRSSTMKTTSPRARTPTTGAPLTLMRLPSSRRMTTPRRMLPRTRILRRTNPSTSIPRTRKRWMTRTRSTTIPRMKFLRMRIPPTKDSRTKIPPTRTLWRTSSRTRPPTDDVPADEDPAEDAPADEGSAGDAPAADLTAEAPAADADERAADSETDHTGSDEPADEDELAADSGEHTDAQPEPAQEDIIVREPDPKPAALSHDAADRVKKTARVGRESFVRQPRAEADMRRDPESSDVLTDDRLLDTGAIRKPEPEDPWRRIVYAATRGVINLGDGKKTRARKELMRRIAAPIPGRVRFVPVLSRKGGVGKTTVTALLGMALADARDDRVVAIDANPDRGTLAERISKPSGKTVRDLVRGHAGITGYADMTAHVTRDTTRLDVLASDADPHVADAFSDQNYRDVADIAQHYYSLVLTDTGTGIIHSVMDATLDLGDQIVIVSGISVDEARLAAETLTWLETNGHEQLAQNAVVVINQDRPGTPLVRLDELESHFRSRVRDVVRIPYDAGIATGSAISFHDLDRATRDAARRLAATVVEGIRAS